MRIQADLVITNASQVFTATGSPGTPRIIERGAVAASSGIIVWTGPVDVLEREVELAGDGRLIDARGGVVTPGLIDPHTHVVFAGSRPLEFQWRLEGRPYLEILQQGGGILATVRAVREADEDQLVSESLPRLQRMLQFGVTTCEVKSGYGLDLESELKILRAARRLSSLSPIRILPTFLGAHAFPPEHGEDREGYVDLVVNEMLPAVVREKLATACDVYVDRGVFGLEQAERILRAAREEGLGVHIHAGQFEDLGGPQMAAGLGALSVDHLDVVSEAGVEAMARSGTVAIMLPGASISLGHEPPRVERLASAGVVIAVATDCNPGTSYSENLTLMAFLACTRMGLSLADAMMAITRNAAMALGLPSPEGTISKGARADIVVHDASDWREILYHFGVSLVDRVLVAGKQVYSRS